MFIKEIVFYGDTAKKAMALKENGIFERILDVYMVSGLIGLLTNKSKEIEKNSFTTKIFPEQLNKEWDRLKYFSSLVTLVNKNDKLNDECEQKKVVNEAFGDWFTSDSNIESYKYQMFYKYSLAGIDLLYERIIGTSTDEDSYYRNFNKLIKSIDKIDVESITDRIIIGNII